MGFSNKYLVIAIGLLAACSGEGEPPAGNTQITAEAVSEQVHPTLTAAEPDIADTRPVIVMLGDSLTAGFGLPAEAALPAVIARAFEGEGTPINIINAGVSGDTTAGGLARYGFSVAAHAPDIVVVALGANDFLGGVDPALTRANLETIIERAQGDGARVLLVGVGGRGPSRQDPRIAAYTDIYPDLAAKYDIPLLPEMLKDVRDKPSLLQSDGLHPTAPGVEIVAGPIRAALEPLVAAVQK